MDPLRNLGVAICSWPNNNATVGVLVYFTGAPPLRISLPHPNSDLQKQERSTRQAVRSYGRYMPKKKSYSKMTTWGTFSVEGLP